MNRVLVLFFLVLASCKSEITNSAKTTSVKQNISPLLKIDSVNDKHYPDEIQKLGVEKLYDKTNWFLYAILYNKKMKINDRLLHNNSSIKPEDFHVDTNITFGMLPLRFEHIELRHDSLEMHFSLYFHGLYINDLVEDGPLSIGCVFANRFNDEIVSVAGRGVVKYYMKVCNIQGDKCIPFENEIKAPEIRQYLLANKSQVKPWFYREAIKRGVINE